MRPVGAAGVDEELPAVSILDTHTRHPLAVENVSTPAGMHMQPFMTPPCVCQGEGMRGLLLFVVVFLTVGFILQE